MDSICVASNGRRTAAREEVSLPSHHRHTHHHRIQQQQPTTTAAAAATAAAGRRVCRKYHRAYIGRLQQREYDKLRRIVPALSALDEACSSSCDGADTEQATSRRRSHPGARIGDVTAAPRARKPVSKIKVIEETIRYIDELHNALARRVQAEQQQQQQLGTEDTAAILETQLSCNSSISATDVDVAAVAEAAKSVFIARVLINDAVTIGNDGVLDDGVMTSRCLQPGTPSEAT